MISIALDFLPGGTWALDEVFCAAESRCSRLAALVARPMGVSTVCTFWCFHVADLVRVRATASLTSYFTATVLGDVAEALALVALWRCLGVVFYFVSGKAEVHLAWTFRVRRERQNDSVSWLETGFTGFFAAAHQSSCVNHSLFTKECGELDVRIPQWDICDDGRVSSVGERHSCHDGDFSQCLTIEELGRLLFGFYVN